MVVPALSGGDISQDTININVSRHKKSLNRFFTEVRWYQRFMDFSTKTNTSIHLYIWSKKKIKLNGGSGNIGKVQLGFTFNKAPKDQQFFLFLGISLSLS